MAADIRSIPTGVYKEKSMTCIVLRVTSRENVVFIPQETLTVEKRHIDDFLVDWTQWLPNYPVHQAAEKYLKNLNGQRPERMTEGAEAELKALAGFDLLD